MACCSCCHFTPGAARSWALLMALIQVAVAGAHFYGGIPFNKITQILGAGSNVQEQQVLWVALGLIVLVRLAFAANPMNRNVSQLNAIVHCIEVIPFCYLAVTNVLLRYKELQPLDIAGGASIIFFSITNASVFYNFWMDRLTGEIPSRAVSSAGVAAAAIASSPSSKKVVHRVARSLSLVSSSAASVAPSPVVTKKKASTSSSRKSSTPAAASKTAKKSTSRSASPKKKAAAPKAKKASSAKPKSRSTSKKAATPKKRAASKKK